MPPADPASPFVSLKVSAVCALQCILHMVVSACGIISPMHLNGAGDGLDYGFSNYIAPHKCRGLYSDLFLGRVRELYDVGFVNAAAWLMTRECVERVGGFSPSFFHYGEDDNYTQRLQFHKLKLGVVPAARIHHDREQRPPGKFFESGETFRREVIARASNPNGHFSFAREWVSVFAHLGYGLARLNAADVKLQLSKMRLLHGIDKAAILANRERSKAGRALSSTSTATPSSRHRCRQPVLPPGTSPGEYPHGYTARSTRKA